ncbi:BQ2448_7746 [Microbotryum intermedium]|uniref:BQ2448_7746 protein n=1 Tax=Microbotryum intermedium TaxID=269621 RepID=A0A238FN54_9BASI|nr:BQ2448_7746 [Microbotryum intermedium]
MSLDGPVSGSDQSTSGRTISPTGSNGGGGKVMNAKRGRKQDDSLPPSRARDVQRAFRARRAEQLSALEDQVRALQQENAELKRELAYYKGETSYPVASTNQAAGAAFTSTCSTAESAATSARTTASISPRPGSRRIKRNKSSSKDVSPTSALNEDMCKEEGSRATFLVAPMDPTIDDHRRTMPPHHDLPAMHGSQDKLWGLDTTTYASHHTQQMYTPPPSAAATVSSAPPWSHASYSTRPQGHEAKAAVSPKVQQRPLITPLSSGHRRPSTTKMPSTDSSSSPTYPITVLAHSATTTPADPKTNSAASVLVEWSKQASRTCSNASTSCCAPSVPAPSADLTAQELCGPSADADCCQPTPVASTIQVRTPGSLTENSTRHHLFSIIGGPEGNGSGDGNENGNEPPNLKNIMYDPNLCCGGLTDCSGALFESSGLSAEEAHALAEASQAIESGGVV